MLIVVIRIPFFLFLSFPKSTMPLFLTSSQIAHPKMQFMVPHREEPWTAKKLEKRFPHLAEEFDGKSQEGLLTFFYKFNKAENIFEFIDDEAEEDFADLLGVKVLCQEYVDEDTAPASAPLNAEQLEVHKNNMAMIREGLEFFKDAKFEIPTPQQDGNTQDS